MASPIPRLLAYVRPYLGLVGAALATGLVAQLCRVGLAALPKPLLDAAAGTAGSSPFAELPLPLAQTLADWVGATGADVGSVVRVGLVLVAVSAVTHFARQYLERYIAGRILVDLQGDLCAKLLQLPLRFHHRMRRGEALTRVLNDSVRARMLVAILVLEFSTIIATIGTGGILAALIFLVGALVIGLLLGGKDASMRSVMGLGTGQRNLAAAMLVAAQNFSDNPNVLVMVMLVAILGLILLMVVGGEMGKRSQAQSDEAAPSVDDANKPAGQDNSSD